MIKKGGEKMSFINSNNDRIPGIMQGNPLNGMCEKVCVQVKKVFDACMKQISLENVQVTLCDPTPDTYTEPLTFVSAKSTSSKGTISNLCIEALDERPNLSRVKADIAIPIEVSYTDADGAAGTAIGTICITEDVVLNVPQPSMIPYEVEAVVGAVSPDGTYVSDLTFNLNMCVTVILKIVTEVELLIPSYGYCFIPPCQEYTQDVCTGFFELPLFPTTPR